MLVRSAIVFSLASVASAAAVNKHAERATSEAPLITELTQPLITEAGPNAGRITTVIASTAVVTQPNHITAPSAPAMNANANNLANSSTPASPSTTPSGARALSGSVSAATVILGVGACLAFY